MTNDETVKINFMIKVKISDSVFSAKLNELFNFELEIKDSERRWSENSNFSNQEKDFFLPISVNRSSGKELIAFMIHFDNVVIEGNRFSIKKQISVSTSDIISNEKILVFQLDGQSQITAEVRGKSLREKTSNMKFIF